MADKHANLVAREGYDRCGCGCKYFENDRCTDCNTHINKIPTCPADGCNEKAGGNACWEHED